MAEGIITDSWKERRYENDLTIDMFRTKARLEFATNFPTLENIRTAYATVKGFAFSLLYPRESYKIFREKTIFTLKEIEKILYGNTTSPETIKLMSKYGVYVRIDKRRKQIIDNGQNILRELWDIFDLTKQLAYKFGFFARKPAERRFGTEAVESVLEM